MWQTQLHLTSSGGSGSCIGRGSEQSFTIQPLLATLDFIDLHHTKSRWKTQRLLSNPSCEAISHLWSFLFPFFESLFQFKLGTVLKVEGNEGIVQWHNDVPCFAFYWFFRLSLTWIAFGLGMQCFLALDADNLQQPVLQEKKDFTVWSLLELSLLAIDQI